MLLNADLTVVHLRHKTALMRKLILPLDSINLSRRLSDTYFKQQHLHAHAIFSQYNHVLKLRKYLELYPVLKMPPAILETLISDYLLRPTS